MNALETFRQALATVQVAYSITPGRQFLQTDLENWEAYTASLEELPDEALFRDSDYDAIAEDVFETMSANNPKLGRTITKRLRDSSPVDWSPELDPTATSDARCRGSQLNRLIVEDCTCSSTGNVEFPQLSAKGECNIPAHLQIESIMKFSPTIENLSQARVMSQCLKALQISFRDWALRPIRKNGISKPLSQRISAWCKVTGQPPWEAPLGQDARPLREFAKAVNDLERTGQETPDWFTGSEINEDIARMFPSEWQEPSREPELDAQSTVGEYTYYRVSRIPNGREFTKRWSKLEPRAFKKLLQSLEELPASGLADACRAVQEKGSFEQKDKVSGEVRRIANQRARESFAGTITVCEPYLEPTDDQDPEPVETVYEEWSVTPDVIEQLNGHFALAS